MFFFFFFLQLLATIVVCIIFCMIVHISSSIFCISPSYPLRVIGLYVSIVFAIGRIIHSYVEGLPFSLVFDEILSPDVLWQLLEDIYLVRNRRKFDLEKILVGRLFAVIRSPESIIQLTEFEKPKRD